MVHEQIQGGEEKLLFQTISLLSVSQYPNLFRKPTINCAQHCTQKENQKLFQVFKNKNDSHGRFKSRKKRKRIVLSAF